MIFLYQFESGSHRVQRIPVTETQGRVHTSTATVAILPQPSEVYWYTIKVYNKSNMILLQ